MRTDQIPDDRPRMLAAVVAMNEVLEDGDWHQREELIRVADEACWPLTMKRETILGILASAARNGELERWPKNPKRAKYGARRFRNPIS